MSSADLFYGLGDFFYWTFTTFLEPLGNAPWIFCLTAAFILFAYWMKRQADYNKQAEADPNQLK